MTEIPEPGELIGVGRWTLVASKPDAKSRWTYYHGWTRTTLMDSPTIITMQQQSGPKSSLFATIRTKAWDRTFKAVANRPFKALDK